TAVNLRGEIVKMSAAQLGFSYRHSVLQETRSIVCDAVFELKKGDRSQIEAKMNELMGRRKDKQPLEFPNAGSTFKRPEGYFAGKLIQDSGLRGFTVGGAQVSEKHCGFVINKGGATAQDVKSLIEQVQKIVLEKTGQHLECEVRIVPFEDKES
ncbi:MAG: UDP-N-acetylenolpyruvoylglucosamine reductase, partial [Ruminococcus sp.]|nr:UDP-N-acetylenolpyruvoylglucosamine reductase [Ruminococcus sp.]